MNDNKLLSKNKKAYFDYEILDSYEAGIGLMGYEVKSIRAGNVNLKGAYISFLNGEAIIRGMYIGIYENSSNKNLISPIVDRKIKGKSTKNLKNILKNSVCLKFICFDRIALN